MDVHCCAWLALAIVGAEGGNPPEFTATPPAASGPRLRVRHFAVIAPGRIVIDPNVFIEGDVGLRYGLAPDELAPDDGDPLHLSSDFGGFDPALDAALGTLQSRIVAYDVDGDARLRLDDAIEVLGLIGAPELVDADGDGAVDDFDLFLRAFDTNDDGCVVYDTDRSGLPVEFTLDDALARGIDETRPDRNRDGVVDLEDTQRGYRDGVLDGRDRYARVQGSVRLATNRATWESAHGASYQTVVHAPIRRTPGTAPVEFDVPQHALPEPSAAAIDIPTTWFFARAQRGRPFGVFDAETHRWSGQVGAQIRSGATWIPAEDGTWEGFPFGDPGAYDYYRRAVFRDMTFVDVRVPVGTNALFENCTFIGVTFIETNPDCNHINWNYAGAVEPVDNGMGGTDYVLRFPDLHAEHGDGIVIGDTRTQSNNLRFDGCTFLGTITGTTPGEMTHWRNAIQFTGATRSFVNPDDPALALEADAATLHSILRDIDPSDRAEFATSSVLLPTWAVRFNRPAEPRTRWLGLIAAGTLEASGALDVFGTVVLTYRPVCGEGPLFYGGTPADFVTRFGGRGSRVTLRRDVDARAPVGVAFPIADGRAVGVER